ncbi:hypothetical protein EN932_04145 [Mesorhizobium sp. M7A.F.Ca.US.002.01.1.1]|uniref:hypothetical protein n=1 Tax=Mesorhizobium sp. M7A.F.Ca.US.002.01.1.1 TaxID=2496700 RepID=UPI000FD1BDBA|nr:hypothetical protein [Mesorhizobium sp. M7A.F.Ca.US.002.01.1.1]RVA14634.1 hypothetical protein EN932_04145 [Mesorhizobium sp. M7A.F.Ca.US.002.01.1.1]
MSATSIDHEVEDLQTIGANVAREHKCDGSPDSSWIEDHQLGLSVTGTSRRADRRIPGALGCAAELQRRQ